MWGRERPSDDYLSLGGVALRGEVGRTKIANDVARRIVPFGLPHNSRRACSREVVRPFSLHDAQPCRDLFWARTPVVNQTRHLEDFEEVVSLRHFHGTEDKAIAVSKQLQRPNMLLSLAQAMLRRVAREINTVRDEVSRCQLTEREAKRRVGRW